jgi:hypothetical protein
MFWKKLKDKKKFVCSKCGKEHNELPAIAFHSPDYYEFLDDDEKKNIAEISDDFCVIKYPDQTDRFIRTTLTFKIMDACGDLDYGIWVSVSEKTFEEYKAHFSNNEEGISYFGIISNWIPNYKESTLELHVNIETRANGIRPIIFPHEADHELIIDWENGITIEEAEKRIQNMNNKVE